MPVLKYRLGGQWVPVGVNGTLKSEIINTAVGTANSYTDSEIASVNQQLNQLNTDLGNTNDYIDNAFHDKVISESEAKNIKAYLNTLGADKADFDKKVDELSSNPDIPSNDKLALTSSKSSYDSAYASLIDTINTVISDDAVTDAEVSSVNSAFSTYTSELSLLVSNIQIAIDSIGTAKSNNAESNANNYTDGQIGTLTPQISEISQTLAFMADDNTITPQEKSAIRRTINIIVGYSIGYTESLPSLTTLDSSGRGEVYTVRKRATEVNISTTDASYIAVGDAYNNLKTYLTGLPAIPWNVNDSSNITIDATAWDSNWNTYHNAVAGLREEVSQKIQATMDSNKADLQSQIDSMNTYIDGSFHDGIIQDTEYRKIEQYLNTLQSNKDAFDNRYNQVYNNTDISSTVKTNLQTAKTNYDSAYTALVDSINTAIADQKATTAESQDVDSKFGAFNGTVASLTVQIENALDSISQKKADTAEGNANTYTDGQVGPINQSITSMQSSITQNTNEISLRVTETTYTQGIQSTKDYADQQASTAQSNAETSAKTYTDNQLQNYVDTVTYNSGISGLQSQIDGNITSWFYAYDPTLSNAPASNWTDDATKNNHLGDLFYNTSTGYGWRFALVGGVYQWNAVKDTDIQKALSEASQAQDTADQKRRVFVVQPTPPYDVGDLWDNGTNGVYRCNTAKTSGGVYSASDWQPAADITSQHTANDTSNVDGIPSNNITTRLTTAESNITENANQINLRVTTTTYTQGIQDTQTYADQQAGTAQSNAESYADNAIELSNDPSFDRGEFYYSSDDSTSSPGSGITNPNISIVSGAGLSGSNVMQVKNSSWVYSKFSYPVDTSRTYRVTFRVRQTVDPTTVGKSIIYAGVATYDASGSLQTSTPGAHRYCAVGNTVLTVADGWMTYQGDITGEGNSNMNQFRPGTAYVKPMFIVNYNGGDGTVQVDLIDFKDVTSEVNAKNYASDAGNVKYSDGNSVDSLKPAQAGADVTSANTAKDTSNVAGVPSTDVTSRLSTAESNINQNDKQNYTTQTSTSTFNRSSTAYDDQGTVYDVDAPRYKVVGNNLLPPFSDSAWNLDPNAKVLADYDLELDASTTNEGSFITVPVKPSTTYSVSINKSTLGFILIQLYDENKAFIETVAGDWTKASSYTFTTTSATWYVHFGVGNYTSGADSYTFSNPQLEEGPTSTPFEPMDRAIMVEQGTTNLINQADLSAFRTSPDSTSSYNTGTQNADGSWRVPLIKPDGTPTPEIFMQKTYTVTSSLPYSESFYYRTDSTTLSFAITFFTTTHHEVTPEIEDVGGGWKRASATFTIPSTDTTLRALDIVNINYTDGTYIDIKWGQVEQKAFTTSFIDGTRANEELTLPTDSVLSSEAWTIEADIDLSISTSTEWRMVCSSWTKFYLAVSPGNNLVLSWHDSSGTQQSYTGPLVDTTIPHVYTMRYPNNGTVDVFLDGGLQFTASTDLPQPFGSNLLYIGNLNVGAGGEYHIDGTVSVFAVSNTARTDADISNRATTAMGLALDKYTTAYLDFESSLSYLYQIPLSAYMYNVQQQVNQVQESITDSAIINTVTQSTEYQNDLNTKANASDLADYATSDDLQKTSDDLGQEIDDKINAIDFSPYVQQSQLAQTQDDITASFSNSGGINLIKNSVGFAGFDFWTASDTSLISVAQNQSLEALGFGSGFVFPATSANRYMYQSIYTNINVPFTLSWFINKTNSSPSTDDNGAVLVEILDGNDGTTVLDSYKHNSEVITSGYEKYSLTYTPAVENVIIRLYAYLNADATITGLMANNGNVGLTWQLAPGEIYNTSVTMNPNGIRVSQMADGQEQGTTVMTPTKFAGYHDVNQDGIVDETTGSVDEVFRVDQDEFVMKKANVRESIVMGSIKVITVNASGHNGWAFVPNK